MASLKILVVDAQRLTLQLAEDTLSKKGHEVRTATDGQAALNLVSRWEPDLILLERRHLRRGNALSLFSVARKRRRKRRHQP